MRATVRRVEQTEQRNNAFVQNKWDHIHERRADSSRLAKFTPLQDRRRMRASSRIQGLSIKQCRV